MVRAVAAGKHTVPCKHSSSICWRGSYAGCEQGPLFNPSPSRESPSLDNDLHTYNQLKTSESLHESEIFMQLLS